MGRARKIVCRVLNAVQDAILVAERSTDMRQIIKHNLAQVETSLVHHRLLFLGEASKLNKINEELNMIGNVSDAISGSAAAYIALKSVERQLIRCRDQIYAFTFRATGLRL